MLETYEVLCEVGRAYICPSMECLRKARKNKGLERSFKMAVPGEIYDSLEKEMEQIEGKQ